MLEKLKVVGQFVKDNAEHFAGIGATAALSLWARQQEKANAPQKQVRATVAGSFIVGGAYMLWAALSDSPEKNEQELSEIVSRMMGGDPTQKEPGLKYTALLASVAMFFSTNNIWLTRKERERAAQKEKLHVVK